MTAPKPKIIDRALLKSLPLPHYEDDASKHDYGKLLVIAGSQRLPGAAILAARAALRCGCGTVRVAAPQSVALHIGVAVPELMVLPLPETAQGTLVRAGWEQLQAQFALCDAVVIGPGLDEAPETAELIRQVVAEAPLPLLLDASALLALVGDEDAKSKGDASALLALVGDEDAKSKGKSDSEKPAPCGSDKAPRVWTPHPGEMKKLLGASSADVDLETEESRIHVALDFAQRHNSTLVLKGRETLVAAPDGEVFKNTAGTRGLGTAGSGDVLAGVIGGLLAQGMDAARGAMWGVHLHALAGEAAQKDLGDDGMMARDFLERLPIVLRFLRRATDAATDSLRPGLRP